LAMLTYAYGITRLVFSTLPCYSSARLFCIVG
jgi:hypothetical protein